MGVRMAAFTSCYITVAAGTFASGMKLPMRAMTAHTRFCSLVRRMAVDTGRYVFIMFAVIYCQGLVNPVVTGSAHFFCNRVFENSIFNWNVRVIMAAEANTPVPLRAFLMRRMAFGTLGQHVQSRYIGSVAVAARQVPVPAFTHAFPETYLGLCRVFLMQKMAFFTG